VLKTAFSNEIERLRRNSLRRQLLFLKRPGMAAGIGWRFTARALGAGACLDAHGLKSARAASAATQQALARQ
jgi:hypothetical protein